MSKFSVGDKVIINPATDDFMYGINHKLKRCQSFGVVGEVVSTPPAQHGYDVEFPDITSAGIGNVRYTFAPEELQLAVTPASESTGVKYDSGKPRLGLLTSGCPNAVLAVGDVLTFGANKYADHNWKIVPDAEKRYTDALLRHLLAFASGETHDQESGKHHLAHLATNALFILELELEKSK